ncbi:GTP cyclohydrolase I FolE [Sneathiella chungangensis]|uniref:GTP cyclohydrolase 1 n=1 Tax=Sneathiella chungangensis TaxID=1418234 RepID=A0A845MG41_9PROT|nr:GTP cyclohydrolase I FolE [Sneathiella chungangensis]MZR22789.1 GTP cyclohydrolase I FolE [Sneathiella chungangensis]
MSNATFPVSKALQKKPLSPNTNSVSREAAEEAVRVLIRWLGDDPSREGLTDTPARVTRAFGEWFSGYSESPADILSRTFEEVAGYDDIVIVRGIGFESFCEHHMAPIIGTAHVAYLPDRRVIGLSKLARLVDIYARRLQIQEKMTAEIVNSLQVFLKPKGAAVMIRADHHCMSTRGIRKHGTDTVTSSFTGVFRSDPLWQQRFLHLVGLC